MSLRYEERGFIVATQLVSSPTVVPAFKNEKPRPIRHGMKLSISAIPRLIPVTSMRRALGMYLRSRWPDVVGVIGSSVPVTMRVGTDVCTGSNTSASGLDCGHARHALS